MADVAYKRIQLVDNTRFNDAGKRIHRILPWHLVTLTEGPTFLEPVDHIGMGVYSTTKQITGIEFVDADVFYNNIGCGGNGGVAFT